jgi:hypothetical protein
MDLNASDKLTNIYESLNSDRHSSFYWPNQEIEKELRDIAYDLKTFEEIRCPLLLELDIFHLQLSIDGLDDFDTNSLTFSSRTPNYLDYFEKRIEQATNPFLLSRYYHILWLERKHNELAVKAINNYFIVKDIVTKQKNKDWALDLLECLKRSFLIKKRIKSEADKFYIEQEIISTILNYLSDDWGFCICIRLLDVIISSHKYFKNLLNENFLNRINKYANEMIDKGQSFKAKRILTSIISIAERMNYDATSMYENLGVVNELQIIELNKSFGATTPCLEAIRIYSKLKNKQKVDKLKQQYEEITKDMKFGVIQTSLDIEPFIKEIQLEIAKLQEFSSDECIQFLIYDKFFIPNVNFISSQARNTKDKWFLSSIVGHYNIFDQRGNLVKIYKTEEEKEWYEIMRTYRYDMYFYSMKLNLVLEALVTTNKISYKDISNYMMNNTWLSCIIKNKHEFEYTYLNIINKLLEEYFNIFSRHLSFKELKHTDFIMFIDSMTLKLEGLIRELFTLKNYPTIVPNNEEGTAQEKDLNGLLHDEHIKTFLNEDELMFYKYIFTEQEGVNLRNRIAHSLFFEQEYDMGLAHFIFLALLRLFKFIIV